MSEQTVFEGELAALMVTRLNLPVAAPDIAPEAPLFREGLGLDSIDMLELSLAIAEQYGVKLRSDDPDTGETFASLRALAQTVERRRGAS